MAKLKFETPKLSWRTFTFTAAPLYERVAHCGSDPLCRQGRARYSIVKFLGWPWTDHALDAASGRGSGRVYRRCS